MSYNICEIDPNMIVETSIKESDLKFYSVRNEPFDVYGLYDYKNEPVFKRSHRGVFFPEMYNPFGCIPVKTGITHRIVNGVGVNRFPRIK